MLRVKGMTRRPFLPTLAALMPTAKEIFLAYANRRGSDLRLEELRQELTAAKLDGLEKAQTLDEYALHGVMPGLYEKIVVSTIKLAAHVGIGVGLALEALDEAQSGASLSMFSREVRNLMTETGAAFKRRHSNRIAKTVAEVEAQRLTWRHNHEFLSWLGFRRDDPRYPAASRRERLDAFKVRERLLAARDAVAELVGEPLCAALEGHDRFMLANRWRLPSAEVEQSIERYVWPLLALQPSHVVRLESSRLDYDALVDAGAPPEALAAAQAQIHEEMTYQLAAALDHLPEEARVGVMVS